MRAPDLLLTLSLSLAGCAATTPAEQVQTSGWLDDYSHFRDDRPGVLYHQRPGVDWTAFRALFLEPVEVFPAPRGAEGDVAKQHFAQRVERTMREQLPRRFELAGAPGPGVIRVRLAVTEAEAAAVVTGGAFHRGRASLEAELLDADGAQLAAAVARTLGGKARWLHGARPEDAQAVADEWTDGLSRALSTGGFPTKPASPEAGE